MGGEVRKARKLRFEGARIRDSVELEDGFAEAEVARRPGFRAGEVAGEEPVGRPLADSGKRDEGGLHLLVGQERERVEVELRAREADDVLGLPTGEAERGKLGGLRVRQAAARRESMGAPVAAPEGLDQTVADREGSAKRDLLGRDRGDERLERVGRKRRAQAAKPPDERPEDGLRSGKGREPVEVERSAEVALDGLGQRRLGRRDRDAAGGRLDAQLDPGEDPVEAAVVPEVREVGPEGAKPLRRELEVERLRERDCERRRGSRRSSRKESPARRGSAPGP